MDINLSAFHFLRPAWLLLTLGGLLLLSWSRRRRTGLVGWRSAIAPALLPYLVVDTAGSRGPRPLHAVVAMLVLAGIGAAGPTWQQDRPAFLDNRAPLMVAVDLSPSMDAADMPPTRLEAVKHKLHDLVARRAGTKTGLIAYAGSAHLILPPTDDPGLLEMFIQALSTDLIEAPGKDAAAAIDIASSSMQGDQEAGGTALLVTDGADTTQLDSVQRHVDDSSLQLLVLAVGQHDEGVLRDARGTPRSDGDGKPLLGRFDADAIKQLAEAADAPLGSLTLNADDLDWVELHAQRHYEAVQDQGKTVHWKDAGYWLCWPLALIALLSVRRGWNVNWAAAVLLAFVLAPVPQPAQAQAGPLSDAFFTADQQGRWAFEHRDYARAATLFQDPYWKGRAAYQAGDYAQALAAFAQLNTPEGYFYLANTQARLRSYTDALAAYDRALQLRPDFPQARSNRDLVAKLEAAIEAEQTQDGNEKPDDTVFDNKKNKGQSVKLEVAQAVSADTWLQNLAVSPAGFLRRKFGLEDARRASSTPVPEGGQ